MKKLMLICATTLFCLSALAQGKVQQLRSDTKPKSCPIVYLGINGGINNHNGLIGISIEKTVGAQFSVGTGIGSSSWGYKAFAEGRFYFNNNCHRKLALGIGFTRNLATNNFETNMGTNYGKQDIVLDLKPATNAFVSLYHFWTIGRRQNKFYTQIGYSIKIEPGTYSIDSKTTNSFPAIALTAESHNVLHAIMPGGVLLGVGWYFGFEKK
jgi:hypothetical protein